MWGCVRSHSQAADFMHDITPAQKSEYSQIEITARRLCVAGDAAHLVSSRLIESKHEHSIHGPAHARAEAAQVQTHNISAYSHHSRSAESLSTLTPLDRTGPSLHGEAQTLSEDARPTACSARPQRLPDRTAEAGPPLGYPPQLPTYTTIGWRVTK